MPRKSRNRSRSPRARTRSRAHGSGGFSRKNRRNAPICPNCGKPLHGRNHLCQEDDPLVVAHCKFRSQVDEDADPMAVKEMKYYCGACDRLTAYRDGVCQPKPL